MDPLVSRALIQQIQTLKLMLAGVAIGRPELSSICQLYEQATADNEARIHEIQAFSISILIHLPIQCNVLFITIKKPITKQPPCRSKHLQKKA